jgi:amino-acid N-acetyltransferase
MEDMAYRRATPADFTAVRALLELCELPTQDLTPRHLERFLVCRDGQRLVGSVALEVLGDLGLLRSLAVAPEVRGRGLAHDLWVEARAEARRLGLRRLYLLTTTAAGLFSRWGFETVARDAVPKAVQATPEFASLCPSSAIVMAIDLGPATDQRVL